MNKVQPNSYILYLICTYVLTVKQACQMHSSRSPTAQIQCVWLGRLSSSVMSNTLLHLSIWYLFGYCLCYYCCCSLIHSPTALISIISHQLIQRNVIIVTRRLMQAVEMRNGLWRGVLQAVTYSGEFLPTLPYSATPQKPWPITELHPSRLCSEAYVSLSAWVWLSSSTVQ